MVFDIQIIGIVLGFTVLANRLVAALATPLFEKYSWDKFWLTFVSWGACGLLVWFSGANLFASYFATPLIGQILTAIVAGGGANILYDVTDQQSSVLVMNQVPNSLTKLLLDGEPVAPAITSDPEPKKL